MGFVEISLMGVMILMYTLQSLLTRKYSDHYPGRPDMASPVFTIVSGIAVAAVTFVICLCEGGFSVQLATVILGVVNALTLLSYNTCLIRASQEGPYSILMIFLIAGGIIVPTVEESIATKSRPSWIALACILVILISVYLVSSKKDEDMKGSRRFFLLCTGLGLANGVYGMLLNMQQRMTGVAEKNEMIAITYLGAAILSAIVLAVGAKKEFGKTFRQTGKSTFYLLTSAATVVAAIHLLTTLISRMDITLLYTFDNASVLLLSVLCSAVFFKEKMSAKNIAGCVTMCAALVVMVQWG